MIFGKKAEVLATQIKKGSEVFVSGKIQNREYTNKDGQKVRTSEIFGNWVRVCQVPPPQNQGQQGHQGQEEYGSSGGMNTQDVPF